MVLDLIREGYKLEFEDIPHFSGIKETKVPSHQVPVIEEEINNLLSKRAIEIVNPLKSQKGFYSTLFLVPKKNGEMGPVINLKPLNGYLRKIHFKMDTMSKVLNLVQRGDFGINLDLKDGYFHLKIFKKHRKYLRFCFQKKIYQFRAMCFGPTFAPRVFSKVMSVVAAYLRKQGMRMSVYLDDWLSLNRFKENLYADRKIFLSLLFQLGFIVNKAKSSLMPSQNFVYIGGVFKMKKGLVFPTQERILKLKKSSSRSSSGFGHSKSLLDFPGNDCIMLGLNSECKVIHETSPASFTSELESCQNAFKPKGCSDSIASSSCEMVVTGSEHSEGKICCSEALFDHCNHRCKWYMGLGWSHEFPYRARPVVSYTEIIAYQCFGNEGSNFDSPALSSCSQRPKCLDSVGQFYSLPIHQSPGGYSVTGSVPSGVGSLASSTGQQHFPQSSSYNGEDEYFSGHFEQADCAGHRMVIEQDNSVKNFQPVGLSLNRSICHQGQQTDTTFLFLASSPSSISIGCPVNCLAEHVCICISTDSVDSKNSESHETFSLQNHSYCTKLAKAALVPSAVRNAGSLSNQSSSSGQSSDSKQEEDCSSKSSKSELNCMASIDRKFSSEGFSNDARKLLSASWRSGTQRDYNGKFRRFSRWCSEQEIDPFTATLKDCAHFLTHLFNSGLKYKTITGYRSMLSSVLAPIGRTPVGQHPVIIRLLRGVFNKRPPLKELIPEWDLPLVLGCLQEPPFEPMKDASLKYVTWKTCFLIAITCFRRCSDLQALRLGEGNVNVQKKGITFMRAGLAKQDRPGHHSVRIFVPSLPKNKKLDPKRALSYYLKKTESFRRKGSDDIVQLFLAINKPHSPVSSQTISKWLVNVIKYAYGIHKKPIGNLKGHSTRSLGSSWALFKGASLEQVLDSADWSRETTFIKHYLKPVGIDFLNS